MVTNILSQNQSQSEAEQLMQRIRTEVFPKMSLSDVMKHEADLSAVRSGMEPREEVHFLRLWLNFPKIIEDR